MHPTVEPQAVLRSVLARHQGRRGALLPILHDVQEALGHIPRELIPEIGRALNLSRAEVHGVVTYYHHFRTEPAAPRVLQLCRAESCRTMGAEALLAQARTHTGCTAEQPTCTDSGWTVEAAYCLGLCAQSPAAMLGGQLHARLTAEKLQALMAQEALP